MKIVTVFLYTSLPYLILSVLFIFLLWQVSLLLVVFLPFFHLIFLPLSSLTFSLPDCNYSVFSFRSIFLFFSLLSSCNLLFFFIVCNCFQSCFIYYILVSIHPSLLSLFYHPFSSSLHALTMRHPFIRKSWH
jgi:hypothetical protein